MEDPRLYVLFFDYLDWSNGVKPTSQLGLVKNAPQEALDAYKEYQRIEKEEIENGRNWE